MVVHSLEEQYNTEITLENPSVEGMASNWGVENAKQLVADEAPDLVIIAFGMNDGSKGTNTVAFKNNIETIMNVVKNDNLDCEFILVAL